MKLKASSIIETIIGIVIIMILLAISVVSITNLQKNSLNKKIKAFYLMKNEYQNIKDNKLYFSDESFVDDFIITRKFTESGYGANMKILQISVLNDKKKVIVNYKEIVPIE